MGIKSFLLPRGMWWAAAEFRVLRKKASPIEQEEGGEADRKALSAWAVKASQFALRKLV